VARALLFPCRRLGTCADGMRCRFKSKVGERARPCRENDGFKAKQMEGVRCHSYIQQMVCLRIETTVTTPGGTVAKPPAAERVSIG